MRFTGLSLLCQFYVSYPSGEKKDNWETHSLTVDNNQIILFPSVDMNFILRITQEAGLYLAEMLYYPIDLIEKFQNLYAITDQTQHDGFCLPQNPELIYCWEQLKTSISRGFSTQIQEHLAMGRSTFIRAHFMLIVYFYQIVNNH